MDIKSEHPYLSVGAIDLTDLPNFLVIVGPNGSGKSQFLDGVSVKTIKVANTADGIRDPQRIILLSKEEDIGANRLSSSARTRKDQKRDDHNPHLGPEYEISKFNGIRDRLLSEVRKEIEEFLSLDPDTFDEWTHPVDSILENHRVENTAENFEFMQSALQRAETAITTNKAGPSPGDFRNVIARIAGLGEMSPFDVSETDLRSFGNLGSIDPFSPQIAAMFMRYRDAQFENRLQRIEDEDEGTSHSLDRERFLTHHGQPPWEILSETIQRAGLNYEFMPPEQSNKIDQYNLTIRKIGETNPIPMSNLSSGEQVRIMFALAAFRFDPLRGTLAKPSLLLLDEMDASLHPSILRDWIGLLAHYLPEKQKISSILTTHSPVTVALAPADSLYEMDETRNVPQKITKQAALNKLLQGVPSLAIDFSGRRQVIVEAGLDAELYQTVFDELKSTINPPRSLAFIPASGRNRQDGGTSRVIDLTERFEAAGNLSVMGLTDWDLSNSPTNRIMVLGQGQFYAIENVLLNPLLIASYLLKKTNCLKARGWTFSKLLNSTTAEKQQIVDYIQDELLKKQSLSEEKESVDFLGGFSLDILVDLNRKNGHDLQDLLAQEIAGFPNSSDPTRPMKELVSHGIMESVSFCPKVLAEAFLELASIDIS